MMNGDISNQIGYTVAFRCEDSLFTPKRGRFTRLLQIVIPKLGEKIVTDSLNEQYLKAMEYIYRNTEYTVDVVIAKEHYTPIVKRVLENLPFNRVIEVTSDTAIATRLNIGDITVYVDEDAERRRIAHSRYAVPLSELHKIIRGRF